MAPIVMECPTGGCNYVTPNIELLAAVEIIKVHKLYQPQVQTKPRAEKVPRPQIKMGIGHDEFSYFKNRWLAYKRSRGITDEIETRDQL